MLTSCCQALEEIKKETQSINMVNQVRLRGNKEKVNKNRKLNSKHCFLIHYLSTSSVMVS